MRWNNLSSETDILNAIKQNSSLLEIKLKGNKFSSDFFESLDLQIQSNNLKASSEKINNLKIIKNLVESSSKPLNKTQSSIYNLKNSKNRIH